MTDEERTEVLCLVNEAWNSAVQNGFMFELQILTPEELALDMMTCDSDIEAFADRVGHDEAKAAIIAVLPSVTGM